MSETIACPKCRAPLKEMCECAEYEPKTRKELDAMARPGDNLDSRDFHWFVVSLTDEQLAWAEHRAEEAGMLAYQWVQHVLDIEVQFAHANSTETRPVRSHERR